MEYIIFAALRCYIIGRFVSFVNSVFLLVTYLKLEVARHHTAHDFPSPSDATRVSSLATPLSFPEAKIVIYNRTPKCASTTINTILNVFAQRTGRINFFLAHCHAARTQTEQVSKELINRIEMRKNKTAL